MQYEIIFALMSDVFVYSSSNLQYIVQVREGEGVGGGGGGGGE